MPPQLVDVPSQTQVEDQVHLLRWRQVQALKNCFFGWCLEYRTSYNMLKHHLCYAISLKLFLSAWTEQGQYKQNKNLKCIVFISLDNKIEQVKQSDIFTVITPK